MNDRIPLIHLPSALPWTTAVKKSTKGKAKSEKRLNIRGSWWFWCRPTFFFPGDGCSALLFWDAWDEASTDDPHLKGEKTSSHFTACDFISIQSESLNVPDRTCQETAPRRHHHLPTATKHREIIRDYDWKRNSVKVTIIVDFFLHICPVLPVSAVVVPAEAKDLIAASRHWPEREEQVETGFKVSISRVIVLDVNMMVTGEQPMFSHGTTNFSNMKSNICVIKG